jgi:hypothetical protein
LLFGPSQLTLAAVDGEGGPPPCGKDGICNLAACAKDPDCPDNVPSDGDSEFHPSSALDEVINCDSTQSKDIRAVAWNIVDDWDNFERSIEADTGFKLGNCTRDRFRENGKVECVSEYNCKKDGRCKLGFGAGLKQKVKIFQTFFDNIAGAAQADRRACYAALLTHEFAHTCEHYAEQGPEAREDAAFKYWRTRFPGSVDWSANSGGCGFD